LPKIEGDWLNAWLHEVDADHPLCGGEFSHDLDYVRERCRIATIPVP